MVVQESEKEHLALPVRVGRIGKIRAIHGIPLPQVAKVSAFEATVRFRALLGEELSGRGTPSDEVSA
jgi:hypothetical protein